jgi:hypothetical protein
VCNFIFKKVEMRWGHGDKMGTRWGQDGDMGTWGHGDIPISGSQQPEVIEKFRVVQKYCILIQMPA